VVTAGFVPDRGDLIWLTFDPQAGHEQAGRRPALVLSPKVYNQKAGMALVCPVTNRGKGYPFEVTVPKGYGVTGVILADHLKSVDWRARTAAPIGGLPADVAEDVLARLAPLLGY
jgi:mRNA interferase MazF